MERLSTWEQRLNDYLASVAGKPHEWGVHDCALHVASAIEAQTGVDLAEPFRGKYEDEDGANAAIRDAGYKSLAELVEDKLPRVPKSSAQRGDIVLTRDKNLAVAFGSFALAVGRDELTVGLVRVPREQWQRAWRVG